MELKNKTKKFRAYLRIEQTNSALSFRVEMSIFQITDGRLLGQLCFCLKLFRNVSGKMVAPIVGQLFDNAGPKKNDLSLLPQSDLNVQYWANTIKHTKIC